MGRGGSGHPGVGGTEHATSDVSELQRAHAGRPAGWGRAGHPPYAKPRDPYDTDHGYDEGDHRRKKKSKLSKLFDIFD